MYIVTTITIIIIIIIVIIFILYTGHNTYETAMCPIKISVICISGVLHTFRCHYSCIFTFALCVCVFSLFALAAADAQPSSVIKLIHKVNVHITFLDK